MIKAIDAKLTSQINAIMHDPDFQQLESAWRGLSYLVNNTEDRRNVEDQGVQHFQKRNSVRR